MDQRVKPTTSQLREARRDNPKMRERDLAASLGVSEGELLAAQCGHGVTRLNPASGALLRGLEAVGEVMALTRNASAVHEKIGVYENIKASEHTILTLGEQIDLRIFPKLWRHAFAVEKRGEDGARHSLQFFDKSGEAVHKVHLRPASDLVAWLTLVSAHVAADQSAHMEVEPFAPEPETVSLATVEELRDSWSKLTDTHQFFGMLRTLKLTRRAALRMAGPAYAWRLEAEAVHQMMRDAMASALPIMCFVGNHGCIQIHSGPIHSVTPMGPWLNIMDKTFHLHLRADHICEAWAVRKSTSDGFITSLEVFDAEGEMIIQFFGKRHEGEGERTDWRALVESLPHFEA